MNRTTRKIRRPVSTNRRRLARAISQCVLAGSAAMLVPKEAAHAAMIWDGGGTTDLWSDTFNWDDDLFPGYGTLTFAGSTRTTNIVDANISMNQLLWTGTSAWTLNNSGGAVISLFDNGGVQAKLENQSTGLVTINAPVTFAATAGAAWGEINAVNGGMTFGSGGTLTVNGSIVNGIRMFGGGQTTTFNNTVSAAGKYFATTAAGAGTVEIGGAFTSGDFYLMNGSTLKLNTGGSLTTSALRLGGDFATTGTQNLTLGATFQLTDLAGGQTFSSIINTVTGNTSGALLIDSLNTAGTNTLGGNIFLDSPLRIQVAAGGTVAATGVISNASSLTKQGDGTLTLSNTNTYTGGTTLSAGTLNINSAGAIGNTTAGALTVSGNSTIDNTSAGAITLTAAKQIALNADLTFTGTRDLNFNGGNITLGGAAGTRALNVAGGILRVNGIVGAAGLNIDKQGAGTLLLTTTTNNSTTVAGAVSVSAGTLQISGDHRWGQITGNGTVEMNGTTNKWFRTNSNSDYSFGGTIRNGQGANTARIGYEKEGTGTLTITGTWGASGAGMDNFGVTNGKVILDSTGTMFIGGNNYGVVSVGVTTGGQNSILEINGGTLNALKPTNPSFGIANVSNGRGFVKMTSGAINTTSEFHIGRGLGGAAPYAAHTQSGGALTTGSWLVVGFNNDRSVLNMNGGSITVNGGALTIATGGTGAIAVMNATAGTVTLNGNVSEGGGSGGMRVGERGVGVLNISGTSLISSPNGITVGATSVQTGWNGTVNLLGGTLSTLHLRKSTSGTGTARLNLNGGTLKATGANATFVNGFDSAIVQAGGAFIDDGGFAITIPQVLATPAGEGISNIAVATGGAGYLDTPVVTITGGSGIGAMAVANVSGGVVTGFTITNPGSGYLNTDVLTVTLAGGGATTAATVGTISFAANTSGGLTKNGTGTLTLTGANTYTGNVFINAGTLATGTDSAVGTGLVTLNGGALGVTGTRTLPNNVQVNAVAGNGLSATSDLTLNGTISGSGTVTKTGASSLFLGGNNSGFTGTLSTSAGFTQLSAVNSGSASATWDVGAAGILTSSVAGSNTIDLGALSGAGVIGNNTGAGTLTFSIGANNASTTFSGVAKDDVFEFPSDPVNVVKTGTGATTFSGANTYTGTTAVNGGTLTLSGTGAINGSSGITINGSGAKLLQLSSTALTPAIMLTQGTLDGTTTVGAVTVGDGTGGIVTNGNGTTSTLTIGALTFNGASTINANVSAPATPAITVTGSLSSGAVNTAGIVTINATNTIWMNGSVYNLVGYGTLDGQGFANFMKGAVTGLGARQNATLTNPAGFLALSITGDLPMWTGLENGNWTTAVIPNLKNWKLQTAGTATDYIEGDTVLFNDTATGTTAVSISDANVNPTSTTFDNTALDYTVSSGGGFGIASGLLLKTGTGSVTLNTSNTFTGGTTISAGTLVLGHATNTLADGGAIAISGGALSLGANSDTVGAVTLTSGSITSTTGVLSASSIGAESGTISAILGGGGALTKTTAGALTLSGANTFSGGVSLAAGTLNLANASALGTGTFAIGGGTIDNTSGGALTLSGNNAQAWNGSFAFTGTNALNLGTGAVAVSGTVGAQTITVTNNGAALSAGGAVSGGSGGAKTLVIAGTGSTTLSGNITLGSATSLVLTSTLPGTLTLGGTSSFTTLNVNGGASSIVDIGAGALTLSNGGGSVLQSTTGGTINGSGTITVSSGGDFGTMGGTTLTVNAKLTGGTGFDFWNNNGGAGLGTVVLAAANTYTGATLVQNEKVVIPAGGAINALNTANAGQITVGDFNKGALSLEGGTINATKPNAPSILVGNGNGAVGVFNQSAGTVTTTNEFWLGNGGGAYGAQAMSGGTLTVGSWYVVGLNNDRAVLNQSGGTINVNANRMTIGAGGAGAIGVVNQTGGDLNIAAGGNTGLFVGENGQGTYNISAGTVTLNTNGGANSGTIQLAGQGTSTVGNFNLNGGTVTTFGVTKGASNAAGVYRFNFNGGTLKANGTNAAFFADLALTDAYVNAGGAVIDTNNFNVTIAEPLLAPTGDGVSSVAVTAGGAGYIGTPFVQITGGGGTGATAVANINASGEVTSITITNPGIGYTSAPTATLLGGGGAGATLDVPVLAANTSGGLTKNGAGTLTLSGTNTFTGTTTVNSGTLALGSAGAIGGGGNVTFGGGSLQFSAANTSDLGTRIVNSTGAISLDTNGQNVTFASALAASNSGGLTKLGTGTLTLTGAQNYTGATSISAGNLSGTGFTGAVTIAAGSTLIFPGTGTIGGLLTLSGLNSMVDLQNSALNVVTLGNGLTLNTGNMLTFDVGAGADRFALSGGVFSATGTTTLNFTDIGALAGTYDLITGAAGISTSNFVPSVATLGGMTISLGVSGGDTLTLTLTAPALATAFWKGDVDAFWNTNNAGSTNWDTTQSGGVDAGTTPDVTTDVIFAADGAANLNTTLGADQSIDTLTISTASAIGIAGANALSIAGSAGITMNVGAGALTISASAVTLAASQSWTNNSSNALTVSSAVSGNGAAAVTRTLTFAGNGAGAIDITGAIGDGSLGGNVAILVNKSGGSVTLSAQNTFTGGTTVTAGTLVLGHATNTLPDAGAVTVNGGTLDIGANSDTVGAVVLTSGSITGTTGVLTGSSYSVESGSISAILGGGAALTKTTAGTVILSGENTYTGGTTISAGTLQIGNGGATGSVTGDITNNAALVFNRSADLTFGGVISGTGSVTQNGAGTVTLTAQNTYGGGTTINAGILAAGAGGTQNGRIGTGPVTVNAGGTLRSDAGDSFGYNAGAPTVINVVGGTITTGGAGNFRTTLPSLNMTGGTVTSLAGNAGDGSGVYSFNAGSTVTTNAAAATATINAAAAIGLQGPIPFTVADGAATPDLLVSSALSNVNYGGAAGGVTKAGPGTMVLSGASTYTGATTVIAGALTVTGSINSGAGGIVVGNAAASKAILNVPAGGSITANNLAVGTNATATGAVYQSGGNVTFTQGAGAGNFQLGAVVDGYGYYQVSGGTLTGNEIAIGGPVNGSTGVMDITGGSVNTPGWIVLGRGGTTSSGVLNVVGGTMNLAGTGPGGPRIGMNWAGSAGAQSVINISNGGSILGPLTGTTYTLDLAVVGVADTLSVVNLGTGGTLRIPAVTAGNSAPTALFNFHGGTLRATVANPNFMTSANLDGVYVYGGGATIDDNGVAITISSPLLAPTGDGVSATGLIVSGSGYIGAPMVRVTGGGGMGATAVATIDGAGNLTGITITNPGVNYSSAPTFTLVGGGGAGSVTGTATLVANSAGSVTKNGAGTTTLSGTNTYNGTTINAGTLAADNDAALGSGLVTLNGGALGASGARTLSNNVHVNAVAGNGFSTPAGSDLTINGSISGSGTATKTGDASLFLGGDNSGFTGTLSTTAGLTRFTAASAGSASATWEVGATGTLASDVAGSNTIALGALSGSGTVGNNTGVGTLTLQIGGNNASTTFSGVIKNDVFDLPSDPVNVVKVGSGTTTFTGANTYSGPTTISAGTFLANNSTGSATGTGDVTVESGATLGGTGAISGNVLVKTGADLAPGASIGTLMTGPMLFEAGSEFQLEINTTTLMSDLVQISATVPADGDFTLSGTVSLAVSDASPGALNLHDHLTFMTYSGERLGAGFFRVPGFNFDLTDYAGNDATAVFFTLNGTQFAIDYDYADAAHPGLSSVALIVVPEPNSIAALFAGLGGLLGLQRFRRRVAK